jgi:D-alanyl-D-alanine carboxypeptidase
MMQALTQDRSQAGPALLWKASMKIITVLALALASLAADAVAADRTPLQQQLEADLRHYLASRRTIEHISALSLSVSFPGDSADIQATAGTVEFAGGAAVTPANLYQIGSNTKAFTAVTLLQLEAEGKLSLQDTLGKWLAQYPLWHGVTLTRLLNMTSGIPTYDSLPAMQKAYAAEPHKDFSPGELIGYVYPGTAGAPAATSGWSYSNTNYVLAELIIEKVTGHSYAEELRQRFFARPQLHLSDAFYESHQYPAAVIDRMVSGYFFSNTPDNAGLAALYGKDMRDLSVSWARGAGAAVSTPTDLTHWVRALYHGGMLMPRQQKELESLVSLRTGKPIADIVAGDSRGFGLGVGRDMLPSLGKFWFYEGETLGYRMIYVWFPKSDVIIAVGINSQPNAADNHGQQLVQAIYRTLQRAGKL